MLNVNAENNLASKIEKSVWYFKCENENIRNYNEDNY